MITSPNIAIKDAVAELKKAPELILLGKSVVHLQ